MKIKLILISIFLWGCFNAFSYTPKAALYFEQYKKNVSNPEKLKALLNFCGEYKTYPYDTLYKYASIAVKMAEINEDNKMLPHAYYFLTVYYYRTSMLDSAKIFKDIGKNLSKKNNDVPLERKFQLIENTIQIKDGRNKDAISSYYQMLNLPEIKKDTFTYLGIMHGIGWANMELQQYEEAKNWFIRTIRYPKTDVMEENKLVSYLNLAVCYGATNHLDSAQKYINECIQLSHKYNNIITEANGYNILADIYSSRNQYDKAIESTQKSMKIREQIGDPFYIVSDLAQLSLLYSNTKQYELGVQTSEKALQIAEEKNIKSKFTIIYESLYRNLYGNKAYKRSADVLMKLMSVKEQMHSEASDEKLTEMKVKYDFRQKEMTIQNQKSEISKKNAFILFSLISLIGITITAFVLYRLLVYRQRARIKSIELFQQQKLTQSIFETEENEKNKIGVSLHDSLGQLLSAIKMNLQFMQLHVKPNNDKVPEIYLKTLDLVEESIKETRNVSHQLLPNSIVTKGLKLAIEDLLNKVNHHKIDFQTNISELPQSLNDNIKINIYRIIQECINNILKHSNATRVFITLNDNDHYIHGLIEDNGHGFDIKKNENNGIGLNNIKTRVEFMKGELDIMSDINKGTAIAFHIPIEM